MNEISKPLASDDGKGHKAIKWLWIGSALIAISTTFSVYGSWSTWRRNMQFYWLWHEPPSFPSSLLLIGLIFTFLGIVINIAMIAAIHKTIIHIYSDRIEGVGTKTWDLLPIAKPFDLKYNEIIFVKCHRYGLKIRSIHGRYSLYLHNPESIRRRIIDKIDEITKEETK